MKDEFDKYYRIDLAPSEEFYYLPVGGSSLKGIQLGDGTNSTALIDTGSPLLHIPELEYHKIRELY